MDYSALLLVLFVTSGTRVSSLSIMYGSGWGDNECGSDYRRGPHSMNCLTALWQGAGCHNSGSKSPINADSAQIRWWNARPVVSVRNDMELYYEYAMNGDKNYKLKCFGDSSCSYRNFTGYALYGLNDVTISEATPKICGSRCDDMGEDCKSFDYNIQTKSCLLSSSNRETAPNAYGAHENIVYYEKVCGEDVPQLWAEDNGDDNSGTVIGSTEYLGGHCYVKYGPIGGKGGHPFDDRDFSRHENITKIAIRHASLVDAIQITYGQRVSDRHGGSGGNLFEFTLTPDEYVTAVSGRTGNYWDSITITTNKRTVGPFGLSGGTAFKVESGGKALAFISGKSGGLVDHLSFYFNC